MALPDALGADLILINGRVLTMDAADTRAEAVAIKGDTILAVGTSGEIEALAGPGTETIDLAGRTALPGLADIHVHLASDASRTVHRRRRARLLPALHSLGRRHPGGHQLRRRRAPRRATGSPSWAARCRTSASPSIACPPAHELDAAAPDHPTYMTFGAHELVANSLALQREERHPRDAQPAGRHGRQGSRDRRADRLCASAPSTSSRPARPACRPRRWPRISSPSFSLRRAWRHHHPRHRHQPRRDPGLPAAGTGRPPAAPGPDRPPRHRVQLLQGEPARSGHPARLRVGLPARRRHQDEHRRRIYGQERRLLRAARVPRRREPRPDPHQARRA